jgi:hypothetical protein
LARASRSHSEHSLLAIVPNRTQAVSGARLMMLVLHDDPEREYAHGPATGLEDTKVGTFSQGLFDEAKSKGWNVISMKKDWKHVFAFDK